MCGRFALGYPRPLLEEAFHCSLPEGYRPQYNFAPGQDIVSVTPSGVRLMRWGFVPSWAESANSGVRAINARSETVFEKPLFREAARSGRCLVPIQAYYEWRQDGGMRHPYCIRAGEGGAVATLAGIGSRWEDPATGEILETVAVLTCEPSEALARIHHRMPVILPAADRAVWLDPSRDRETVESLLVPYPSEELHVWPVSTRVNDTANRDAGLMEQAVEPGVAGLPLLEFSADR